MDGPERFQYPATQMLAEILTTAPPSATVTRSVNRGPMTVKKIKCLREMPQDPLVYMLNVLLRGNGHHHHLAYTQPLLTATTGSAQDRFSVPVSLHAYANHACQIAGMASLLYETLDACDGMFAGIGSPSVVSRFVDSYSQYLKKEYQVPLHKATESRPSQTRTI